MQMCWSVSFRMHRYPDAGFYRYTLRRSFYGLVHFYALFHIQQTSFVYRTKEVCCYDIRFFRGDISLAVISADADDIRLRRMKEQILYHTDAKRMYIMRVRQPRKSYRTRDTSFHPDQRTDRRDGWFSCFRLLVGPELRNFFLCGSS